MLSGEENLNSYFGNADSVTDAAAKAKLARDGVSGGASIRKWERFDPRFDVSREPNRFGWIVELDPSDPGFVPRKRTAMGRFKHEAATVRVTGNGTVASYMGDDERFDYLYKFVSSRTMRNGRGELAHNLGVLDEGTLYVARFTGDSPGEIDGSGQLPSGGEFDGTGQWIPLARSNADGTGESFVAGMSVPDVLVHTRLAGDAVGATKMDRPEDVEPHPRTGKVYAALTNNNRRGVDAGAPADGHNPRNANKHGHVLELTEDGDDPAVTTFSWELLCIISHVSAGLPQAPASTPVTEPPADGPGSDTRLRPAALRYQTWGWPITLRRNQVWLTLEPDTVALIIPAMRAQATAILSQRRCLPPALVHPDAPEHRVLLAGEPYGVDLPWPPGVYRATGALLLPPTMTPRGPVTWVHPPQQDALRACREVDVFAALRTALRDGPPGDPPSGGDPAGPPLRLGRRGDPNVA